MGSGNPLKKAAQAGSDVVSGGASAVSQGASDINTIGTDIANTTGLNNVQGNLNVPNIPGAGGLGRAIGSTVSGVGNVINGVLTKPGLGLGNLQGELGLPNAQIPQFPTLGAGGPDLSSPTAISPDPSPSTANTSVLQSMAASESAAQVYATQLTSAQGLLDQPSTSSRILVGHP